MRVNKTFDGNKTNYLVWSAKHIAHAHHTVHQIIWSLYFKLKVKKINHQIK